MASETVNSSESILSENINCEGLGSLQEKILLWISAQCGMRPVTSGPELGEFLEAFSSVAEFIKFAEQEGGKNSNALFGTVRLPHGLPSRELIVWNNEKFLKRKPTRSDSANLSKALRTLEKRGLIRRYTAGSKRGRPKKATHVFLTGDGAAVCFLMWLKKGNSLIKTEQKSRVKRQQAEALEKAAQRLRSELLEGYSELTADPSKDVLP